MVCPGSQRGAQVLHRRVQAFRPPLGVFESEERIRWATKADPKCECFCVCAVAWGDSPWGSQVRIQPGSAVHNKVPASDPALASVCTDRGTPDPVCSHTRIHRVGCSLQSPVHLHKLQRLL